MPLFAWAFNKPHDYETPEYWEAQGLPGFGMLIRESKKTKVFQQCLKDGTDAFKKARAKRMRDRFIAMIFAAGLILVVGRYIFLLL